MTYRGRIQNGVVVLEGSPSLDEGTLVDVVPLAPPGKPKRGSAEAIMQHAGIWADVADEVDRQLAELKEMKRAEIARTDSRRSQTLDDDQEK